MACSISYYTHARLLTTHMLDFFMRLKRIQLKSLHTTPMLTSTIFTNPIVHHVLLHRPYVHKPYVHKPYVHEPSKDVAMGVNDKLCSSAMVRAIALWLYGSMALWHGPDLNVLVWLYPSMQHAPGEGGPRSGLETPKHVYGRCLKSDNPMFNRDRWTLRGSPMSINWRQLIKTLATRADHVTGTITAARERR